MQNQLEALLEEAHIKLSAFVSDLLGLSAQRMLKAIAEGETNPAKLAALADKRLRATKEQLCDALGACAELNVVYRRLLRMALEELRLIDEQIKRLDQEMALLLQAHQDMTALADPGLLRMVLDNLIGNAWKFTGKTAGPRIVIGMEPGGGEGPVYFVQDNGAGFNMEFADQLFAPFQRLHRASEFEGTGVGLATVQRVIHRHGGRIWAESTPGSGARFMFTLGTATKSKRKIGER